MYLPRVQHGVYIPGGYDRNEGGRLAMVAHGGGCSKGGMVVAAQLAFEGR